MDAHIRVADWKNVYADLYRLLPKEEAERLYAIRQRKQTIADGAFKFLQYYLWDHQNERPEILRQWIEDAEQLIAIAEQVLDLQMAENGRVVGGDAAQLEPESFIDDIRRIWNEMIVCEKVVHLDTVRRKKQAMISDEFELQQYYSREHRKEHPSVLRYWAKHAGQLIATTEQMLGRSLAGNERRSLCEAATLDPESVDGIQRILDEIALKR